MTLIYIFILILYDFYSHGQRFSYWTNEARELLKGALEPVYRVPKKRKTEHEVNMRPTGTLLFVINKCNNRDYLTHAYISILIIVYTCN